LLAPIVAPGSLHDGRLQWAGVQTLALTHVGEPLEDSSGRKIRRVYGQLAKNGVLLGQPEGRLVVGEGIESVFSAMRILNSSFGLASLSAVNLPQIILPPCVRAVEIASDHDDAGLRAAEALLQRLQQEGLQTRIAVPDAVGKDFNDVLRSHIQANGGSLGAMRSIR
jgi:hypothetical protein